jgi:hypothetical protein
MTAQNVITGPARATKGASGAHPSAKYKIDAPVNETTYKDHRTQMGGTVGAAEPFSANPSRSKEQLIIDWVENPLTSKQSFTYHLRLTMLSPKDNKKIGYSAAQTLNSENGIVVAETGVTSKFNITDLETNHVVSWTPLARAAYGLTATMTITEPLGVTLLDNIVRGAKSLGIENHTTDAVYLLEISFKDSDDAQVEEEKEPLPYHFIYVMAITDFTIAVDEGGAKYYLKLVEIPQIALRDSVQNLKSALTIKANTLGQFAVALTKELNELSAKEAGTSSKFPDTYNITIDESSQKMSQWVFVGNLISAGAPKYKLDMSGDGGLNSTFHTGNSIVDILSVAVAATKEMQELPLASGSSAKASGDDDERPDPVPRLWFRIVPDVRLTTNYDSVRKVNQKNFIYKIKLEINDKVGDMSGGFAVDKTKQKARLREMYEFGLLTKKYMYMYTGQNTEILNFDIKLNNTYWIVKARYDGMYSNPDNILSQSPNAEELKEGSINSPQGTKMASPVQEVAESPPSATPATAAGPKGYLQQDELNSSVTAPKSGQFLSNITTKTTPGKYKYLESFSEEDEKEGNNWFVPQTKPADIKSKTKGFVDVAGPSAFKFGAVYADMAGGTDLVEIELNIIGDPYWLGMSNINKQYANKGGVAAHYDSGSNLFYFKLLMPQEHDETGDTVISDSFTLSGLYGVREVISSYSNGGFTQHLYGYRSLASNYDLLKEVLDATEEKKEKPSKTEPWSAEDQLNSSTTSSTPQPLDRGAGIQ